MFWAWVSVYVAVCLLFKFVGFVFSFLLAGC